MSKSIYFDSFVSSVELSFNCPDCGHEIETHSMYFPSPNYLAERYSDATECDTDACECGSCGKQFDVTLCANFGDKNIEISGLHDDYPVEYVAEDHYSDDEFWNEDNNSFVDTFQKNIAGISHYLSLAGSNKEYSDNLHVMSFAHVISAMEGFLSSSFIHAVFNDDELFKKLLTKFPTLKEQKISLIEAIEKDGVKRIAEKALKEFIFHNVKALKSLYASILEFDLTSDMQWMGKAVTKRHDCAHRAGYTKDGERNVPTTVEILDLISNAENLVVRISDHLYPKPSQQKALTAL
jgi:hypothetical protein